MITLREKKHNQGIWWLSGDNDQAYIKQKIYSNNTKNGGGESPMREWTDKWFKL